MYLVTALIKYPDRMDSVAMMFKTNMTFKQYAIEMARVLDIDYKLIEIIQVE